jgi:hypothetical protein
VDMSRGLRPLLSWVDLTGGRGWGVVAVPVVCVLPCSQFKLWQLIVSAGVASHMVVVVWASAGGHAPSASLRVASYVTGRRGVSGDGVGQEQEMCSMVVCRCVATSPHHVLYAGHSAAPEAGNAVPRGMTASVVVVVVGVKGGGGGWRMHGGCWW